MRVILCASSRRTAGFITVVKGFITGRCRSVFVDKPFAVSTDDAQHMLMQAAESGTRIFTSSAFRYADDW